MNRSKLKCLECGYECLGDSSDYENIQRAGMCIRKLMRIEVND